MKKAILPTLALVALILGLVSIVRSQPKRESSTPPSPPPESSFEHSVAAVGLIEASTENISIGTHLSGVVDQVYVVVGDTVKAGERLFKLDDRHLRAQLGEAQAAEQVAEAQVTVAAAALDDVTRHLEFAESLSGTTAISREELTARRSAVQTAQAKLTEANAGVRAAAAQIEIIETELQRSIVTSPIEGDVLQVKLRAGEFAAAGETANTLLLLGRSRPLHVRVDVDEHEAWRVRPEAKAEAAVRGNAKLKTGLTFVRFEPFVLPKKSLTGDSTERVDTRVLQVIYRIEREDLRLFVGQQMDVFIDVSGADAGGQVMTEARRRCETSFDARAAFR
jgi:multidrug efflux pump subunit AcrA (membrane-fusion protein)